MMRWSGLSIAPAKYLTRPPTAPPGADNVTLVLGSDFADVKRPPKPQHGKPGHGKATGSVGSGGGTGGGYGSATFVQTRNAGASICSGLPASNRNSGSPP